MNDIIELKLDEVGIAYKMYAPNRSTNLIERIVDKTKKPYEYEMLVEMKEGLERVNKDKSGVILDVGLNIGNHALFFAALGYKVIGIEANPKMVAIAQKSVEINGFEDKIQIIQMGASDKEEKLEFEAEIPHNYGMMHLSTIKDMGGGSGIIVDCKPIDSLKIKEKICLIKMDIEGMEAPALRGAKELIAKNKPLIYIESQLISNFTQNANILEALGYLHFKMWDMGAATHLFRHLSDISDDEMKQKIARDFGILRLHNSSTPQGTISDNREQITLNELASFKDFASKAFVRILGGQIGEQKIAGEINEIKASLARLEALLAKK